MIRTPKKKQIKRINRIAGKAGVASRSPFGAVVTASASNPSGAAPASATFRKIACGDAGVRARKVARVTIPPPPPGPGESATYLRRDWREPPGMTGLEFVRRCYDHRSERESRERRYVLAERDRLVGPKVWADADWQIIKARLYYAMEYERAWQEGTQTQYNPQAWHRMVGAFSTTMHREEFPSVDSDARTNGSEGDTMSAQTETTKTTKTTKPAVKPAAKKVAKKATPAVKPAVKPAVAKTPTIAAKLKAVVAPEKTPSQKKQVYAAWLAAGKVVDGLLGKYAVKGPTIRGWANEWKRGKNLPGGITV
jgi:hypothetical protein